MVGLCFGKDFGEALADWVADGQKASRLRCNVNSIYVLRASIADVHDAEISAYFHDVSVTNQDAQEKTQEHANDERPTRKVVFEEPLRSSFVSQWTTQDDMLTTDGELHTRHRRRSVSTHREKQRTRSKRQDEHEERTKGKQGRAHTTTTSSKILGGWPDRNQR